MARDRHRYDKQCGCSDCTGHELTLQRTITAEPKLHVIRFTAEYWDYLRASDPIAKRGKGF
jgi:hypothetical protein